MTAKITAALEQPQDHTPGVWNVVPTGWKLVPVEPSSEMIAAGKEAMKYSLAELPAFTCYNAMLRAAPRPPVVEQQSDSDMVSVPRSLLGAACAGMRHRLQDAPKVLEHLRRYTVGDLSKSAVEQQQPKRKPLTDEQISDLWIKHARSGAYIHAFVQAIERTHGIGGEA